MAFCVNLMDGDTNSIYKLDQKKRVVIAKIDKIIKVWDQGSEKSTCPIHRMSLILVLTIFNKGAYLMFKSIFHKALNLF